MEENSSIPGMDVTWKQHQVFKRKVLARPDISALNLSPSAYNEFAKCTLLDDGTRVEFAFPTAVRYQVTLDYVLEWCAGIYLVYKNGRWRSSDSLKSRESTILQSVRRVVSNPSQDGPRATRIRHLREPTHPWTGRRPIERVKIYLDSGIGVEVWSEHVLYSCEPNYEYYGWFSAESMRMVAKRFKPRKLDVRAVFSEKDIQSENFGTFARSSVAKDGQSIHIVMKCGDSYDISSETLTKHFGPIESRDNNRARKTRAATRIAFCRRTSANRYLLVGLVGGEKYRLACPEVLEACDYRYENFRRSKNHI